MTNIGTYKKKSVNGYESTITQHKAQRCQGCPLRSRCHKATGERILNVNHRLNELKQETKELLMSEKGLYHRGKRCVEPEAVFGQLKSNNRFNRFTFFGMDKVNMELILMAMGHNLRKLVQKLSANGFSITKSQINLIIGSLKLQLRVVINVFIQKTENQFKIAS